MEFNPNDLSVGKDVSDEDELYRLAHSFAPIDTDRDDYHHTLGYGPLEAAPGNHIHPDFDPSIVPEHSHKLETSKYYIKCEFRSRTITSGSNILASINVLEWANDPGEGLSYEPNTYIRYRDPLNRPSWFLVMIKAVFDPTSTAGYRMLNIYKYAPSAAVVKTFQGDPVRGEHKPTLWTVMRMNSSDRFAATIRQNSGVSLNITTTPEERQYFEIIHLGFAT